MKAMPWDDIEKRTIEIGVMDEDPKVLELDEDYSQCSRYAGVVLTGDEYAQCRIASLGAGPLRGIFAPPRKGDQVLVLFPGGRENSGIILGGLNSEATPLPPEADSEKITAINNEGIQLLLSAASDPDFALRATEFLTDLQVSLSEISGLLNGLGLATPNTAALLVKITTSLTSANLPYRSRNVEID